MRHIVNYGKLAFLVDAGVDPQPLLAALAAARPVVFQRSTHGKSGRRCKIVIDRRPAVTLDAVAKDELAVVDRGTLFSE